MVRAPPVRLASVCSRALSARAVVGPARNAHEQGGLLAIRREGVPFGGVNNGTMVQQKRRKTQICVFALRSCGIYYGDAGAQRERGREDSRDGRCWRRSRRCVRLAPAPAAAHAPHALSFFCCERSCSTRALSSSQHILLEQHRAAHGRSAPSATKGRAKTRMQRDFVFAGARARGARALLCLLLLVPSTIALIALCSTPLIRRPRRARAQARRPRRRA